MEYKRIDENTIRCIITEEDMENFGLDLDEFLSHSQKSDDFLRHIVEEARDELGYETQNGMVSMRLEVLSDNRISLTFASGDDKNMFQQMMGHLQKIFPDVERSTLDHMVEQLSKMPEKQRNEKVNKMVTDSLIQTIENLLTQKGSGKGKQSKTALRAIELPELPKDTYRIYTFNSLNDLLQYCHAIGLKQPIKSHLYKDRNKYYLIVERYRISDYNYNLLAAVGFEYAKVSADPEVLYTHLMEYGELILENKAIGILRKI